MTKNDKVKIVEFELHSCVTQFLHYYFSNYKSRFLGYDRINFLLDFSS